MTEPTRIVNEQVVRHTVEYLPVTKNLVAIKTESVVTQSDGAGSTETVSQSSYQDVYPIEAVDRLLKGLRYNAKKDICLMTDNVLSIYRKHGFLYPSDFHRKGNPFEVTEDDLLGLDRPFDALAKGLKLTPVHMYFDGGMLFHPEKDEVYPCAIHFEYLDGGAHNEKYDLNKAIEILKKNPDVSIQKDTLDRFIRPIPHYNANERQNQCISFDYSPDYKTMNEIWKTSKKIDPKYPTCNLHDAIDAIDALGLIEGGAMDETYIRQAKSLLEQ